MNHANCSAEEILTFAVMYGYSKVVERIGAVDVVPKPEGGGR